MPGRKNRGTTTVALASLAFLAGCAAVAVPYPPAASLRIPPGHLPPPGACRIWFPDRPPGHQPPPGPCAELRFRVPPGAHLVYGG